MSLKEWADNVSTVKKTLAGMVVIITIVGGGLVAFHDFLPPTRHVVRVEERVESVDQMVQDSILPILREQNTQIRDLQRAAALGNCLQLAERTGEPWQACVVGAGVDNLEQ